jgi:membrane protein DedA with SNARE-associated domain
MEYIPDKDTLLLWLDHYGTIGLFVLLALGIIALPVPEETLMVITGVLIDQGHLSPHFTLLAAYLGSMTGITVSYLLGRTTGAYLLERYGKYIGFHKERIEQAHQWFEKYGKWSLFVGYFIPGVRHFTGLVAGTSQLQYSHFALYAYLGAFFWVSTFVSLGYFFGAYGISIFEAIEFKIEFLLVAALFSILGFVGYKVYRKKATNGQ